MDVLALKSKRTSFAFPVPGGGILLICVEDTGDDTHDIVKIPAQPDRLAPQTSRRGLANDGVDNRLRYLADNPSSQEAA